MDNVKSLLSKPWIFIVVVLLGVSLKFYRLDYKMFWYDELATVFHVSGVDDIQPASQEFMNKIVNINEYTRVLKHSEFNYPLLPQLKKQITNMNLNPLHYPLLSLWYRGVGDEFIHYRLFSVLVFLLTLPFMFLLARELFGTVRSGWIAASLYSVSPFVHYFAQEARYYILWAFLLAAIHFFLLKAVNTQKNKFWLWYVVFAVLSLYASILSGVMIVEHLLFVWLVKRESRLKFLLMAAIIFVLYSPWLYYIFENRNEVFAALAWHKFETVPLWAPLLGMVLGYVRTFSFYQNYTLFWDDVFHNITPAMKLETFFNVLILILMIAAAMHLIRKSKKENAWFILLLIVPGLIFFYSLDIARNAITTHWWRYYIFNTIPLILLVTSIIEAKLEVRKWLFPAVYAGLVVIGVYSIFTISNYRYWYLGGNWQQEFVDNALLLSEAEQPLLITDFMWRESPVEGRMHAMESLVDCNNDKVDVLLVSPDIQEIEALIPADFYSKIYVIYASGQLQENLQNQFGERLTILPGNVGPPRWELNQLP